MYYIHPQGVFALRVQRKQPLTRKNGAGRNFATLNNISISPSRENEISFEEYEHIYILGERYDI